MMNARPLRRPSLLSRSALAVLATASVFALAACTPPSDPGPPAAVLTQVDVPGTTPLSAAPIDLSDYGYTETEYYAAGEAHRYRGAVGGALETAEVIEEDAIEYQTRVLVRTPEPDVFNGTLLVEWTNVTLGVDADFTFGETFNRVLEEGYAYAVVSVQGGGVEHLTTWSPERYGDLTVAAENLDPDTGEKLEPCFLNAPACPGDVLSWDIMTQVSRALLDTSADDAPLAGLSIENIIATGQSQSAGRLTTYYNTIQPLAGLFDGFVFWDAAGDLRTDLEVPGISVNSESFATMPFFPTSDFTRRWYVAGSTHGSLYVAEYMDTMLLRDESKLGPEPLSFTQLVEPSCDVLPPFSTVPAGHVVAKAFDAVREWVETGEEAAPTIDFTRDASAALVRDANADVVGGVRLAEFVAPTAVIVANNGIAFPCSISGHHRDLTAEELTARYGTHEAYVEAVRAASEQAVADGYLLAADAELTIAAAEESAVAK